MYHLSEETPADWWEVEALYDLCFAPGREALSSYRLRDDIPPVPELSMVARDDDGILAGAIRFWPIEIHGDQITTALLLGPVAVHPTRQGEGLGGALIRESVSRAASMGLMRVMLVGDAPYYERFGFRKLDNVIMPPPTNPNRVLAFGQETGVWEGVAGKVRKFTAAT